jgi:hypothetical protein
MIFRGQSSWSPTPPATMRVGTQSPRGGNGGGRIGSSFGWENDTNSVPVSSFFCLPNAAQFAGTGPVGRKGIFSVVGWRKGVCLKKEGGMSLVEGDAESLKRPASAEVCQRRIPQGGSLRICVLRRPSKIIECARDGLGEMYLRRQST